jgi:hypothetical protein
MIWKEFEGKWSRPNLNYWPSICMEEVRETQKPLSTADLNVGPPKYVAQCKLFSYSVQWVNVVKYVH